MQYQLVLNAQYDDFIVSRQDKIYTFFVKVGRFGKDLRQLREIITNHVNVGTF
jgi:hypothetical protein